MTKTILLAGAMIFAAPALAQTAPAAAPTDATPAQTAPAPATTTPSAPATVTPSAQSAATPSQSQVAQVVDQNFATYDKDGDGSLSKAEFSAWMGALKAQSATAPKETPAQATAWNDAAFKQADGDKSAGVTRTELTGFLVRGASQAS